MNLSTFKCFGIVVLCCIASCKEESLEPIPYSYEYFPVEYGRYIIYDVDSVYHSDNDNNNDDSVYSWHFQVKEKIDSSFIDGQGRVAQRILRYRRDNSSDPWNFLSVWTQTRTTNAAYRFEENIVFHKLSFPVNTGIYWDGNDSNTLSEEIYTYEDIHASRVINAMPFDSTLSVMQRNDDNFVEKIYGYEVYARDIGLIFKQRDNLRKQSGLVVFGTEFKMTVHSYGIE